MKIHPLLLVAALGLSSCQNTINPYTGISGPSKTTNGALIGGLLGAGIGALTGDDSTERRQRALIGAGAGALTGATVGSYMDAQEAELRRELNQTGVSISRQGNQIVLNMPGDITFPTGEARVSPQFFDTLTSVAKVLSKYEKTLIDVTGHTDNVGDRSYNQRLSELRATNVANFIRDRRVDSRRFRAVGQGMDSPVASNSTAAGRQQNRRVTIQLAPLQ